MFSQYLLQSLVNNDTDDVLILKATLSKLVPIETETQQWATLARSLQKTVTTNQPWRPQQLSQEGKKFGNVHSGDKHSNQRPAPWS